MKKMKNRWISLLVLVALMTTLAGVSVGATASGVTTPALNEGQEGLLRYLGILDEEAPDYGKTLNRGELAHIAAKLSALPEYTGESSLFHDVPVDHPCFNDVHALAMAGIVSGDGDGYYRPGDSVSDMEACKIFAVVLGYKEAGYFADYFKTARTVGITDGITMDGTISYGDALVMAYNTLHLEMFMPVSFGDEIEFRVQKGFYALENYFNLVRKTGRIEGVAGTTLTHPNSIIEEGYILIGGRQYRYDAEELIGQNVVFYGEKDSFSGDIKKEIAYLYADPDKNTVLMVEDKDIIGKTGDTFRYWKNKKETKVPLLDTIDVIYNGVAYPGCQDVDWAPNSGQVRLIDNNDDGVFDLAIISAYQYLVCQGIDKDNQIIYGTYPQATIGNATQDKLIDIRSEKGRHKLESLKNGDVLAIMASRNTEGAMKIEGAILGDSILGKVNEISESKIKIEETEYIVSGATVSDYPVKIGETVSVYLHNGIVGVILHASNDTYKFGYLINATTEDSAFSSKLKIKLVDPSRQMHEYKAVDKLKIDESPYTDGTRALARLRTAAAQTYQNDVTEWKYSQAIRYRLNTEGFLTHIDTMIYDRAMETEESLRPHLGPMTNVRYSQQSYNLVQAESMIFTMPSMTNAIIVANEARDEPQWYPTSMNRDTIYVVEGFNVDPEGYQAEYAVVYTAAQTGLVYNAGICIVAEKSTGLDADGYPVDQLDLISTAGVKTSYGLTSDVKNVSVSIGDVVRFVADPDGNITSLEVIFKLEDGEDNTRVQYFDNSPPAVLADCSRYLSYGTILSYKNDIFTHTSSVDGDLGGGVLAKNNLYNFKKNSITKFFIYDSTEVKPQVRICGASDVVPYLVDPTAKQNALMINEYGTLRTVYIIK